MAFQIADHSRHERRFVYLHRSPERLCEIGKVPIGTRIARAREYEGAVVMSQLLRNEYETRNLNEKVPVEDVVKESWVRAWTLASGQRTTCF